MDFVEVCTLPLRDHHSHQQSLALVLALLRHYNKHVVSGHSFGSFEFTSLILSKTPRANCWPSILPDATRNAKKARQA